MKKFLLFFFFFCFSFCYTQNADFKILHSINKTEKPLWDESMRAVSFSIYPVMPVSICGIWVHGRATDDPVLERNAYKGAMTLALAVSVSTGLKLLIQRDRPFVTYPTEIIRREKHVGPYSFPSGHTTTAFATATAISMSYKKWYVTLPSYVYAGFVAYSRMRLGVHYPTDLLGGIIIGVGSGLLTWQLDKTLNGK